MSLGLGVAVSFSADDLAKDRILYNFTAIEASQGNDELPGLSAFYRDGTGDIFHTYSSYARGPEELSGMLMILDRVPKRRNEAARRILCAAIMNMRMPRNRNSFVIELG